MLITLGGPFDGTRASGLAVLDNGVERPLLVRGRSSASKFVSGPEGVLFGYNDQSGFEFEVVTLAGAVRTRTTYRGMIEYFNDDIAYADHRVFARTGEVIDVRDPSAPARAGKFAVSGVYVQPVDARSPIVLSPGRPGFEDKLWLHFLDTATVTIKRMVEVETDLYPESISVAVQAGQGSCSTLREDSTERLPSMCSVGTVHWTEMRHRAASRASSASSCASTCFRAGPP